MYKVVELTVFNVYTVPTGEMVIMTELDLENHDGTPSKHSGVF